MKAVNVIARLLPASLWRGRFGLLAGAMMAKLLLFDAIWCAGTTFRAMSDPGLYANALVASLLVAGIYVATRRCWPVVAAMLLVDIALAANLMYCRTYFTAIPPESYLLAGNLADFTASVADSMRWADLLLPLTTVAAALLCRRWPEGGEQRPRRRGAAYLATLAAAVLLAVAVANARGGFMAHYTRLHQSCYYTTCTTPIYTVAGSVAYNLLSGNAQTLDAASVERIQAWMRNDDELRPYRPLPDSIGGRDNLVVVLCESLESWVVGLTLDGVEVTPTLNALVADTATTLYAPNVLTQVAAGRSIDCQLLVNAGMLPMHSGVYSMSHPRNRYYTLNQALAEARGARSYLLTCDKPIVWNQEPIARSYAIDTLLCQDAWHTDELVGNPARLSDGSFMRQAVDKMRSGEVWPVGQPAFVQLVTYSGHNPFRLPEELRTVSFSDRYPRRMRDYMEMAHYTDGALATLLDYLRTRPDYHRTLVVIVGDHEGLAMHRAALVASPAARGIVSRGRFTPLIVANSPVGGRYDGLLGQVDIYPTLLNLLRLDDYPWRGFGQSLLDPARAAVAVDTATGELLGDTAAAPAALAAHLRAARDISDLIIATDAFATIAP